MDLDLVRFIAEQNKQMKDELKEDIGSLKAAFEDHKDDAEKRILEIEKFNWKVGGIGLALVFLIEIGLKLLEI